MKCKRCGMKVSLTEEDINNMLLELEGSGVPLAADDIYEKRLGECMKCDKLLYGSTCMLCGAIVQVRCRMEKGRCPYSGRPKWR